MTTSKKIRAIRAMFEELLKLLGAEGKLHNHPWLKIGYSLSCLADSDPTAIDELKVLVKGIHTGPGSLFDLVLKRVDRQEMIAVNDRLDRLRDGMLSAIRDL